MPKLPQIAVIACGGFLKLNVMENLERIKEDLVGALITLGKNSLSDKEKIKECDRIILETIKFIEPIISLEKKKELFIEIAGEILSKKNHNISVIQQEYRDGDVWFEFYVASHDYSVGRDSEIIKQDEIEKEILMKSKSSHKL